MADYIVVPGKFNIYVACNFTYTIGVETVAVGTPTKLGEMLDDLVIQPEQLEHMVPGDRNGGRAGDGIEFQFLGQRASVNLEMSRFDKDVAGALQRAGGLITTPGTIPDTAIGGLMLRDASYRFTFVPIRDATRTRNFPCGIVRRPHILAGGTKFETFSCEVTFHRAPEGHWTESDNVLFDADTTGIA